MAEFIDLHLPMGFPIQMQIGNAEGSKQRYFCKLLGCIKGQAVMVSPLVTGGIASPLQPNDAALARLMIGRGICVFPATVLSLQEQPFPLIYLSYPTNIDFKPIRGAERVETNLRVVVNNALKREKVSDGFLRDISIQGARLETVKHVADIGDEITISGDFAIENLNHGMRTNAVVRSKITPPTGAGSKSGGNFNSSNGIETYGVELRESNPSKKLILYGYVNYLLAQTYLPKV